VAAGVVPLADLPAEVADVVGRERRVQLGTFVTAMLDTIAETGTVALRRREADALDAFRAFNYERIYLRPESAEQARRVISLIRALTEHLVEHPREARLAPGSEEAVAEAVRYVSGMTDRFALDLAVERLGWRREALPQGV
jgi:dGTPase